MIEPGKIVACPSCDTLNRVPVGKPADDGTCGRCKGRLFTGAPLELTGRNFAAHAQKSDVPLVIDFWAGWCGPCRQMAPAFAAAARQLEPSARLAKLDTEAEPAIAARFQIRSIPTIVVIAHGKELARRSGALPERAIVDWVRQSVS